MIKWRSGRFRVRRGAVATMLYSFVHDVHLFFALLGVDVFEEVMVFYGTQFLHISKDRPKTPSEIEKILIRYPDLSYASIEHKRSIGIKLVTVAFLEKIFHSCFLQYQVARRRKRTLYNILEYCT